jgi:hypothetical protein
VPFEGVRAVWKRWQDTGRTSEGSRFVGILGGDHGLVGHVDRIVSEVRAAAPPR